MNICIELSNDGVGRFCGIMARITEEQLYAAGTDRHDFFKNFINPMLDCLLTRQTAHKDGEIVVSEPNWKLRLEEYKRHPRPLITISRKEYDDLLEDAAKYQDLQR